MTLLKDLIEIPEHVGKGDFVFTLENAVDHPDEVLRDYVVTEQLQEAFDESLDLIKSALDSRESRASYLHGSFGSGKSHFMAILYLLLSHIPEARAVPELQRPLARHDAWLEGKRFLLIPVHMINSGADTIEKAVFEAYVDRIDALHPDAPTPGVYASQPLIEDALRMRNTMEDSKFFEALNSTTAGQPSGLGKLAAATWDATSFEQALEATPGSAEHDALLAALIESFFSSYRDVAGEKYVSFEEGLAAMSRHAKQLGYDALILFLDELILWLATRIADMTFVQREGQKLTTLREAPIEKRPVPIVSIVARQRDLRELIGDHYPGAEQRSFHDALSYSEGRFSTITLEDRNLRAITEKRVLKPKSPDAKAEIDRAFEETMGAGQHVVDVLLGSSGTPDDFRAVYPFSPAFIDTLVAASSALQRERTAIRVMIQLLSERREELEVGDLVPVGDLFDVLSGADEPFSQELKQRFKDAKRLYETRLRPQIAPSAGSDPTRPLTGAAAAEDRLVKTLLLAALIPDAEPLRGLTASTLVALNHGTIATPIPGQETSTALAALRRLRGSVGQLKIQEGADPVVQIELSGIDTERIVESARKELDNAAARKRLVRDFVRESLGLGRSEGLFERYSFQWRGSNREVEIALENVRELSADRATSSGDEWKLVIDFPFDVEGSSRQDDEARIEELREHVQSSKTVFWLPSFVTRSVQRDLGLLVTLEGLLVSSDRLNNHAAHLNPADREKARQLLESQRSQLRSTIRTALEQAYGVAAPRPDVIEGDETAVFESLEPSLQIRPPVATDLKGAVEALCDQLLRHQFPAHPEFGTQITKGKISKVWALVQRATEQPDGRLDELERNDRSLLKEIAEPLELGEMHEGPFVLGGIWRERFLRAASTEKLDQLTVADLRRWIEQPESRGLDRDLQHLVILTHAARENLSFQLHGGPYSPSGPSDVRDELVLTEVDLPSDKEWQATVERAATVFGIQIPPLPSAQNLDRYGAQIQAKAEALRGPTGRLLVAIEQTLSTVLDLNPDADRVRATRESKELVDALAQADAAGAFRLLGDHELRGTPEEISRTLAQAAAAQEAVANANWDLIEGARKLAEAGDERAAKLVETLERAASETEMVTPLAAALRAAEQAATEVVVQPPVREPAPGGETHSDLSVAKATETLENIEDPESVLIDLTIRRTTSDSR